jgi:hypothetical protein
MRDGAVTIQIPWQPPQSINVRRLGSSYVFTFRDGLGRQTVVQGETIGYGVTLFISRVPQSATRFVIYGDWLSAYYRAYDGTETAVMIYV